MVKKRPSTPTTTTPRCFSLLRRSSSAPIDPAILPTPAIVAPPPPPESLIGSGTCLLPPLPPNPHGSTLFRTISDPTPFLSPNHNSHENGSESPASKRLRRMSQRVEEMKQWFDELINESDQDCASEKSDDDTEETNAQKINEQELQIHEEEKKGVGEETVSAERKGDAINVRFKCPCGSSYHILLLGQDCYYNLL